MNPANPYVIRCPDRNDGRHPQGGETRPRRGRRVCVECGAEVVDRRRPRHPSARAGQRIAERDYEGA